MKQISFVHFHSGKDVTIDKQYWGNATCFGLLLYCRIWSDWADNCIITSHLSGPVEQSVGCVCVSICPDNNFQTKW